MLFPTTVFAIFFAIVFTLHWGLPEKWSARKWVLLVANLVFYGWWSWKFALMLLASSFVNHGFALWMEASADERKRKRLLAWSVGANLLVLAFFKYTGFLFTQCFLPLAVPVCNLFGASEALFDFNERVLPLIQKIVLPVGISFYTFQALSYVVDVYRRNTKPARSVLDFANYLAFFPQLVAGPIVRAVDLLPQMDVLPGRTTCIDSGRAMTLVLGGLFKKMVVANWIAINLADPVFSDPESYGWLDTLLGVYGYAIQIYCDFSAYSDIAIGCALLLGFHFPDNFHAPYLSVDLQEFWRRWHISLSSWLRDYLYIPLGGSRCGKVRVYVNLLTTMLLGGLWHGANWCFVIWGGMHGAWQAVEHAFRKPRVKGAPVAAPSAGLRILHFLQGVLTFHFVCFAWIFFRAGSAEGMTTVREVLCAFTRAGEGDGFAGSECFSVIAVAALVVGFLLQFLDGERPRPVWNFFNRMHPVVQGLIAALLLTLIVGLGPSGVAPFIYFQF